MSRAFVREDEGERWQPPAPRRAYRIVWRGHETQPPEVVRETDDLLDALRWLQTRDQRHLFELRDGHGVLLATAS
ncbi:hypothetical protein [Deinococcus multiflagellatus]|uniref:hypothetical protein n=1 Tax=Deinococcus multiflagellatus TaxID=1656887 RepID=UPI001CCFAA6C|nr:hypothetical protein [Deinococcus multiflagellatus]MBZ9712514.1 hypothetical protein [Deinococcus multiflagellatus]